LHFSKAGWLLSLAEDFYQRHMIVRSIDRTVLPACRKNCPGPIKQGHLHLQVIPVNELDYLVNPLPSDT